MTNPPPIEVTVVDVGHGSATLFRSQSELILVDTGPGIAIVEFLLTAGVSHVDCVVISHADRDHVGGLIAMISTERISIGTVILNGDGDKSSAAWKNLAYSLDSLNRSKATRVVPALREADAVPTKTPGLSIVAVAPRQRLIQLGVGNSDLEGKRISSNSMSAVLVASYFDRPFAVMTGDMDCTGWAHLRELEIDLRADLLVAPHHGGWGGTKIDTVQMISELCARVQPTHVFVSNGRGSHGSPRKEVVAAVRVAAPLARVACTQVAEQCLLKTIPRPHMRTRGIYSAGARRDACCAGSISIEVSQSLFETDMTEHEAFINHFASTALCRATPPRAGHLPDLQIVGAGRTNGS